MSTAIAGPSSPSVNEIRPDRRAVAGCPVGHVEAGGRSSSWLAATRVAVVAVHGEPAHRRQAPLPLQRARRRCPRPPAPASWSRGVAAAADPSIGPPPARCGRTLHQSDRSPARRRPSAPIRDRSPSEGSLKKSIPMPSPAECLGTAVREQRRVPPRAPGARIPPGPLPPGKRHAMPTIGDPGLGPETSLPARPVPGSTQPLSAVPSRLAARWPASAAGRWGNRTRHGVGERERRRRANARLRRFLQFHGHQRVHPEIEEADRVGSGKVGRKPQHRLQLCPAGTIRAAASRCSRRRAPQASRSMIGRTHPAAPGSRRGDQAGEHLLQMRCRSREASCSYSATSPRERSTTPQARPARHDSVKHAKTLPRARSIRQCPRQSICPATRSPRPLAEPAMAHRPTTGPRRSIGAGKSLGCGARRGEAMVRRHAFAAA